MTASSTHVASHPPSRPIVARLVDKLVAVCGVVPYALVALGLRFVMARVFLLDGQAKIEGPVVPFNWLARNVDFSLTLPTEISDAALQAMQAQYANLPIAPVTAA